MQTIPGVDLVFEIGASLVVEVGCGGLTTTDDRRVWRVISSSFKSFLACLRAMPKVKDFKHIYFLMVSVVRATFKGVVFFITVSARECVCACVCYMIWRGTFKAEYI